MNRFLYLLVFLLLCTSPLQADGPNEQPQVRVGIFPFQPINYIDENGEAQGLNPDLLREIASQEGWTLTFVPGSWQEGLDRLQSEEIDLMMSVAYTAQRAEIMDYTQEATVEVWGQVFIHPNGKIENITDLQGERVGVMSRDINGQNFAATCQQLGVNCELVEFPNFDDVFSAVQAGEITAGVAPQHFGLRHADDYDLVPSSIQFSPFSIYFAAKNGRHHQLLSKISSQLDRWKLDPKSFYYQRLSYWLGGKSAAETIPAWAWWALALICATTLLSFATSVIFKAQVRKRTSELLKKDAALLKSQKDYREVFNASNDAIFIHDALTGDILDVNQAMLQMFGYRKEDVLELSVAALSPGTPPYTQEEAQKRLRAAVEQGPQVFEWLARRSDGEPFWVEVALKSYQTEEKKLVIATVREITERKKAEAALKASEEKFSRTFKLSPDAFNLNRLADGVFIETNQGFTNLTGWTADEVIGRSSRPDDLNIWCHDEDREHMVAELNAHGEANSIEAEFRHKDGSKRIGLLSARLIALEGETCVLSITRDITERVRLAEERHRLEERILQTQKLESLGVLAGGIAHDFNNILMAILGHCELALRRINQESPAKSSLEQIKDSANKAADLTNQMLAYSGRGKFVVEPHDLSQVIAEMEQMLRVSISKNVLLRYDFAPHLPTVDADATQLRQIIMNLAINASDAIGERSGVVALSTGVMDCDQSYLSETWLDETLPAGQYVFLEVADTGCGMEKEIITRIFEPFFSTKFTGRGLGMAAVLGIVRSHKGAIKVYSEVGKGTTFKVLFPATSKPALLFDKEESLPQLKDSGLVLLVDDDETVRSIGRSMLEELGFEVLTANDGRDALNIYTKQRQQIRFVLMDLTMPHLDGEQAFREMRRVDAEVKVIMSSGYNEQDVSQRFIGKGLSGFLKKPYQLSSLQEAIRKLLAS